jgi:hypothetical protein
MHKINAAARNPLEPAHTLAQLHNGRWFVTSTKLASVGRITLLEKRT